MNHIHESPVSAGLESQLKEGLVPTLALESRTVPVTLYAQIMAKPELRVEQETTGKLTLAELGQRLRQVVKGWSSPPLIFL